MSAPLTKQQVKEYKFQLMSRFDELQQALKRESESSLSQRCGEIDSEFEGCINLLFDLNYADRVNVSEKLDSNERH